MERVARQALGTSGLRPSEVDFVVSVSCTGFMIPAVDAHVAGCANCNTYVTQYQETIRAAKLAGQDAQVPDLPDDLAEVIVAALAKEPR